MISYAQWGNQLYSGERSYPIVKHRKKIISAGLVLILLSIGVLLMRGLNPGIEFRGGSEFTISQTKLAGNQSLAYGILDKVGAKDVARVSQTGSGDADSGTMGLRIQTLTLTVGQVEQVRQELVKAYEVEAKDVTSTVIGPTWGADVSKKAAFGLVAFVIMVALLLGAYFRNWMSPAAALFALLHDFVITIGVYALTQVEVTPATVIGFLTILGYSLYDTVVVFDKIRENTTNMHGQSRYTYHELVNLSINQTMVRSINTSVVAILPVAAILFFGGYFFGGGTLRDIAMPLFIGMIVGTLSSIFIASPLLTYLWDRKDENKAHTAKVMRARGGDIEDPEAEDFKVTTANIKVSPVKPGRHLGNEHQPSRKKGKKS
ncbi:MAG: protein translocase subunit SecF [Actinomycetaceae bacterium]|nr:protein translocase subunit SecF [Actinomycetaceae bacterium]